MRLELTTYRLTAGRAADCAIQELFNIRTGEVYKKQSQAGLEPAISASGGQRLIH